MDDVNIRKELYSLVRVNPKKDNETEEQYVQNVNKSTQVMLKCSDSELAKEVNYANSILTNKDYRFLYDLFFERKSAYATLEIPETATDAEVQEAITRTSQRIMGGPKRLLDACKARLDLINSALTLYRKAYQNDFVIDEEDLAAASKVYVEANYADYSEAEEEHGIVEDNGDCLPDDGEDLMEDGPAPKRQKPDDDDVDIFIGEEDDAHQPPSTPVKQFINHQSVDDEPVGINPNAVIENISLTVEEAYNGTKISLVKRFDRSRANGTWVIQTERRTISIPPRCPVGLCVVIHDWSNKKGYYQDLNVVMKLKPSDMYVYQGEGTLLRRKDFEIGWYNAQTGIGPIMIERPGSMERTPMSLNRKPIECFDELTAPGQGLLKRFGKNEYGDLKAVVLNIARPNWTKKERKALKVFCAYMCSIKTKDRNAMTHRVLSMDTQSSDNSSN